MKKFLFITLMPFMLLLANEVDLSSKKLNIAFGFKRPPFLFSQTSNKGIEIDLVIGALKLQGYQIGNLHQMTRRKQVNILETNQDIDIAVTVPKVNKKGIYYSDFIAFNNLAISRTKENLKISGINDLLNYQVGAFGLAHKFSGKEYFKLFNPTNAPKNYTEYERQSEQHEDFFSKKFKVLIGDKTIFDYHKNLYKYKYKTDVEYTYDKIFSGLSQRHIAFKDKKLRDDFNIGYKKLKQSGEYDKIVNYYINIDVNLQLKISHILAGISSLYIINEDKKGLDKIVQPFYDLPFIEGMKFIDNETKNVFFEKYKSKITNSYENLLRFEQFAFFNKVGQPAKAGKLILYFNRKVFTERMSLPPISKFDNFSFSEVERIEKLYMENFLIRLQEKIILTDKEKEWLKNNPIIKVHNQKTWAPLNFNENGVAKGFSIDYMNLLASISGIKVKYIAGGWGELLQQSYDKKIDVMLNIIETEERKKHLLFVGPYIKNMTSIVVNEKNKDIVDIKSLSDKTIAVIKGYAYEEILKRMYPDIKLVIFDNLAQALKAVLYGKADATIGKIIAIRHLMKEEGMKGLKFTGDFSVGKEESSILNIAVRNNAPELHGILKKAMEAVELNKVNQLKEEWLGEEEKNKIFLQSLDESRQASVWELLSLNDIMFFLFLSLLLLFFFYQYNSKLKFLNIKIAKFIFIIISFEFTIIFYIIYSVIVFDRLENRLEEISTNKFNLIQTLNELKQSSDDLTEHAMMYIFTKNFKHKQIYNHILDIRNGKKRRPEFNESISWEISEKFKEEYNFLSNKISLKDKIQKLPYTKDELNLLNFSEKNSNKLLNLEKNAFLMLENHQQNEALNILHSPIYNDAKESIIEPIAKVLVSVHKRSNYTNKILEKKIRFEFFYIVMVSIIFILGNILIYYMLNKKLIIPIRYLKNAIQSFRRDEKNIERKFFYDDEIGEMNKEFFSMKSVIKERTKELEDKTQQLEDTIKNLKITQEKLVENEKMASLGSLVAGVAHEINTPVGISLTGITHFEYLTKNIKNNYEKNIISKDEFENYLTDSAEIANAIKLSLMKAVEQIQSFKRVAVDQSNEQICAIDLKEYLGNILSSLHNKLKKTNYKVSIDCADNLIIESHPGAISQIITNFILNSLIHGFKDIESGNINISAKKVDNMIELEYKDNGNGIKKENLKKIFDPFFTTNREGGGSGLGLHIIYNIVRSQLKGDIEVKSKLNHGVVFIIKFPLKIDNKIKFNSRSLI